MANKIVKAIVEKNLLQKSHKKICEFFMTLPKRTRKKIDRAISKFWVNAIMRKNTEIDNNLIFFTNFSGEYECNPGYICKEMVRRNAPYKLVFVIWGGKKKTKFIEQFPQDKVCLVKRYSYDFYKALCSAKVIIDNGTSFIAADYNKKKEQILINTWHGSLGIKKFSKDDTKKNKKYGKKARREVAVTNYLISNSSFVDFYFRDTWWPDTPILQLGHARNDILFLEEGEEKRKIEEKIRNIYDIGDKKICLYAPTFRDSLDPTLYNLDFEKLLEALTIRFGGEWVIFLKYHFRTKYKISRKSSENVINVSTYPDIQELMAVIDVGITDYSSWICDYIHTRKPGFLYARDLENYATVERGFYDPIEAFPFSCAKTDDELYTNVLNYDQDVYSEKCRVFLEGKGCMDDGKAAFRACNEIENMINGRPLTCDVH